MGARLRRDVRRTVINSKQLRNKGIERVTVGFTGINALKARVNEVGNPRNNVPARPFMRAAIKRIRDGFRPLLADLYEGLEGGLTAENAAELGDYAAFIVSDTIKGWTQPPNAPSTIARKGFNDPLVETGEMRDSVRVWVKPRRGLSSEVAMRRKLRRRNR